MCCCDVFECVECVETLQFAATHRCRHSVLSDVTNVIEYD